MHGTIEDVPLEKVILDRAHAGTAKISQSEMIKTRFIDRQFRSATRHRK